jgi:hypothetical protein
MIPSSHINEGNITFEMFNKTIDIASPVDGVYLHRKSLKKSQQTQFKKWCSDLEIPVVSSKDFANVSSE